MSSMTKRYKWLMGIYLFVLISLIISNCWLDYHHFTKNSGFHNLTYFQRNAIRVMSLAEVVLSPFEILTSLFVNTSNVRDTENLNFFAYKMIALPFSFLWYFKTIRLRLFAFLRTKLLKQKQKVSTLLKRARS